MTSFHTTPVLHRKAARNDLLMVQQDIAVVSCNPEAALRQLGFQLNRQGPDHWVVTAKQPLPELHFYSTTELARFVVDRAHDYLNPGHRSAKDADTADLPG